MDDGGGIAHANTGKEPHNKFIDDKFKERVKKYL